MTKTIADGSPADLPPPPVPKRVESGARDPSFATPHLLPNHFCIRRYAILSHPPFCKPPAPPGGRRRDPDGVRAATQAVLRRVFLVRAAGHYVPQGRPRRLHRAPRPVLLLVEVTRGVLLEPKKSVPKLPSLPYTPSVLACLWRCGGAFSSSQNAPNFFGHRDPPLSADRCAAPAEPKRAQRARDLYPNAHGSSRTEWPSEDFLSTVFGTQKLGFPQVLLQILKRWILGAFF